MTPDFLAGLFIGSMLVYACWLLSLRLEPEPPDPEDRAIPACPECRPDEPHFWDCPVQHPPDPGRGCIAPPEARRWMVDEFGMDVEKMQRNSSRICVPSPRRG